MKKTIAGVLILFCLMAAAASCSRPSPLTPAAYTPTATITPSVLPSATPSATLTNSPAFTASDTPTQTITLSQTGTYTITATLTATSTVTATLTATQTPKWNDVTGGLYGSNAIRNIILADGASYNSGHAEPSVTPAAYAFIDNFSFFTLNMDYLSEDWLCRTNSGLYAARTDIYNTVKAVQITGPSSSTEIFNSNTVTARYACLAGAGSELYLGFMNLDTQYLTIMQRAGSAWTYYLDQYKSNMLFNNPYGTSLAIDAAYNPYSGVNDVHTAYIDTSGAVNFMNPSAESPGLNGVADIRVSAAGLLVAAAWMRYDDGTNAWQAGVMVHDPFDYSGFYWSLAASVTIASGTMSFGYDRYIDVEAVSDTEVYLACSLVSGSGCIRKWNGTAWSNIGPASGIGHNPSLAVVNGAPYCMYSSVSTGAPVVIGYY